MQEHNHHISPIDLGPLDHPALAGISQRELADLPLPRWHSTFERSLASEGDGCAEHGADRNRRPVNGPRAAAVVRFLRAPVWFLTRRLHQTPAGPNIPAETQFARHER
jgi:hypothetical protein